MAEEELDQMEEEDREEQEGSGSPLLRYLPIIVGVLVVQIIIAYVLASWIFAPEQVEGEKAREVMKEEIVPLNPKEPISEAMTGQPLVVYEKLEVIVVNPAETKGHRFVSTKVHLGLRSPEVEVMINENKLVSKINDTLVGVLSAKTVGQLEPSNHNKLKDEIKENLNKFLGANAVLEVYFQSFVLQ